RMHKGPLRVPLPHACPRRPRHDGRDPRGVAHEETSHEASDFRLRAAAGSELAIFGSPATAPSHYLFVWAMEAQHPHASVPEMTPADIPARRSGLGLGKDFLAVFDV